MKHLFICFLLFFSISINAQTKEDFNEIVFSIYEIENGLDTFKIKYCIADLDKDSIPDSLSYDLDKTSLLFLLSTRSFEPFFVKYEDIGNPTAIFVDTGYFDIRASHMRSLNYKGFIYDSEQKRFRLASINHESYGNALNDGSGAYYIDLLEGEYEGYMNFHDYGTDTLLSTPVISMRVDNDPVYLDEEEWILHIPTENLFKEYIEKYTPDYSDTITFIGYDIDYDFWRLLGQKDEEIYSVVSNYFDNLNRGDIISLKVATSCYQEVADKSIFYVFNEGTEAVKIKEGKLSQFYRENKKEINYHNIPTGYHYQLISPADVDYFLANTTDKTLLKYFMQPGSFDIEYSDNAVEDFTDLQLSSGYTYFVTIVHKHKNVEKPVCKLILCADGYITEYYLFDKKTNTYKRWEAQK